MFWLELAFWLGAFCVFYTYLGYPLVLGLLARWGKGTPRRAPFHGSVSIVVAAHNEEAYLGRRLRELLDLLKTEELGGEVIVVSDGSTDRTAEVARSFAGEGVRLIELGENHGKAAALSAGVAAAQHDILVFADARQRWDPRALGYLLENFAEPAVGAVGGELLLESRPGVLAWVGLYWRLEKWLRRQESRLHSTVGVTGAICAVRRELFRSIPDGTLLDDVYWPLQVAMQGYRVVHDERAWAYDRLPVRMRDEFRRKVRTLTGNYQLAARLRGALVPVKNPLWWQYLSHKLARLVVPWVLVGMLIVSAALPGAFYDFGFRLQVAAYGVALLGTIHVVAREFRPAGILGSFLVLNTAAWLAFWVWISGRANRCWRRATYVEPAPPPADVAIPATATLTVAPQARTI